MISDGSTMCRFDDQHATAKAIIRRLASKPDITLALQEELEAGKALRGTGAFGFIVRERERAELNAEERERMMVEGRERMMEAERNGPPPYESVKLRKEDEARLNDDIVVRVRQAIEKEDEEARKKGSKATVKTVLKWLLGVTSLAMGISQVALQV